jgi:ferric iron reductase protein FhuF
MEISEIVDTLGSPRPQYLSAIDRLTFSAYASFAGHLVGVDDPRAAVGADFLLNEAMRGAINARFAKRFASFDIRAAFSIWTKWYLNVFLPPVLLADVLLTRTLPIGLNRLAFILNDDTRVTAVKIDGPDADSNGEGAFQRFAPLIFDHLEPLIEMWAQRSGVTRRVLWSNAGNTFEAMLSKIESVSGSSQRSRQARHLLNEPFWQNGRPNPLFGAVRYVPDGDTFVRRRRICCIQYMLPDRKFCAACPIEEARAISSTSVVR